MDRPLNPCNETAEPAPRQARARSPQSAPMRAAMADRIAREVTARELTCADVQRLLGERSDGAVRTELALIKNRRVDHADGTVALSVERLLKYFDICSLGWEEAVAQPPARLYRAAA